MPMVYRTNKECDRIFHGSTLLDCNDDRIIKKLYEIATKEIVDLDRDYRNEEEYNTEESPQYTDIEDVIDDDYSEIDRFEDQYSAELLTDKLLNYLPVKDRTMIKEFYGIEPYEKKSLEEIGKEFKLTGERVRQMIEKSYRMLKLVSQGNEDVKKHLKYLRCQERQREMKSNFDSKHFHVIGKNKK